MRRRELLVGIGVAGAALAGCSDKGEGPLREAIRSIRDPRPPHDKTRPPMRPIGDSRILNRAAFGPSVADVERLQTLGKDSWLAEQLKAPLHDKDESQALQWRLNGLEVFRTSEFIHTSPYDLRDMPQKTVMEQLSRGAILRSTYSKWQLRERLCDFWANHLNIYARKVFTAPNRPIAASELMYLLPTDLNNVVRKNALGSVRELIAASMKSSAMLGYLDQQVSDAKHPNENYARELLELHTLGVDGGYSQKDVMEVARCLTGWTIEDRALEGFFSFGKEHHATGSVYFDKNRHDDGEKLVLGEKIPAGGGEHDAERVLQILVKHPSTARFISRKLVNYFYGEDEHSAALTEKVAESYKKSDGAIPAMMHTLLTAPEFDNAPPILKRPFEFTIAALRATNALTDGSHGVQDHITRMGQPLYEWPMPNGYPEKTQAWTGSLLARWNFATALAAGEVGATQIDKETAEQLLAPLPAFSGKPEERIALALASPEFQWR